MARMKNDGKNDLRKATGFRQTLQDSRDPEEEIRRCLGHHQTRLADHRDRYLSQGSPCVQTVRLDQNELQAGHPGGAGTYHRPMAPLDRALHRVLQTLDDPDQHTFPRLAECHRKEAQARTGLEWGQGLDARLHMGSGLLGKVLRVHKDQCLEAMGWLGARGPPEGFPDARGQGQRYGQGQLVAVK
jgi:hypothetical protein